MGLGGRGRVRGAAVLDTLSPSQHLTVRQLSRVNQRHEAQHQ